ncbi:hypothetical protein Tco_1195867 [Tanacetum coccineum]
MLAPSGGGRKAYLLEDKQIPSVGVFDEVFSTCMAFGGNTQPGDGVTTTKRQRHDIHGDDVRDSAMASGHHGFIGYPFDYRVPLGFGSIAGGLDHVNLVIRLPLEYGISRVLGKDDHSNPSVRTNSVTSSTT